MPAPAEYAPDIPMVSEPVANCSQFASGTGPACYNGRDRREPLAAGRRSKAVEERIDRTQVSVGSSRELDEEERERWFRATIAERLRTITYLRECFYGPEATTGRLHRVHRVLRLKSL